MKKYIIDNIGYDIQLLISKRKEIIKEFLIEQIEVSKDLPISLFTDNELKIDLKKAYNEYTDTNRKKVKNETKEKNEYSNLVFLKDLSKFILFFRFLLIF